MNKDTKILSKAKFII